MKKLLFYAFICSYFISCSKSTDEQPIDEPQKFDKTLIIGSYVRTPFSGPDLPEHGFLVELIQTAMERAEIKTEVKDFEWTVALKQIMLGQIDIVPGLWYTEERIETIAYGAIINEDKLFLISKKGRENKIETIADLDSLKVGVVKDYAYPKEFLEATNFYRDVSIDLDEILTKLNSGEIDATLDDKLVSQYTANKLSFDPFYYSTEHISIKNQFYGVSRKTPNFREIISLCNKALDEMRADGTYDKLLKKHIGS